jgi:hypothetical protein
MGSIERGPTCLAGNAFTNEFTGNRPALPLCEVTKLPQLKVTTLKFSADSGVDGASRHIFVVYGNLARALLNRDGTGNFNALHTI